LVKSDWRITRARPADILIACVDGLKGFPEAIESIYPNTQVQLCIVHMVRNSLKIRLVQRPEKVVSDLKKIYQATTEAEGKSALVEFGNLWTAGILPLANPGGSTGNGFPGFFAYPEDIRRIIYTTNAIESLNNSLRKVTKNRAHSERRGRHKAAFYGLKKHHAEMDNARPKLGPDD